MSLGLATADELRRHVAHPHAHNRPNKVAHLTPFGPTQSITTGNGKEYMRVPQELDGMNLVSVGAQVVTASSSGVVTIQIHNVTDTVDMLSTEITIDANELDSSTAATPAVIDTANDDVATGDQLRLDVDTAGTDTEGLMVTLGFRRG